MRVGQHCRIVRNRVFMPPKEIDRPRELTENETQEGTGLEFVDVRQIYEVEAPRLRRYFQARLRSSSDDAGDLVQESFIRLLGCMAKTSLPRPAAYLQRIARNLLLDRYKRLETRLAACHVPIGEQHEPAVAPDQATRIEVEDMMRAYRRALGELPDRTRDVFLLHRVDELTYKEIAGRLGISIPTVQYHVARALAHIDAALEQE
ncbi:RNA polymerase sigma factor [Sphingobium limneticum]